MSSEIRKYFQSILHEPQIPELLAVFAPPKGAKNIQQTVQVSVQDTFIMYQKEIIFNSFNAVKAAFFL